MNTATQVMTLEAFLTLPETEPGSELIKGEILQKPMPQGKHSRLQSKLSAVINQVGEDAKIAYAFTELRCSFGGDSVIPDIAVVRWDRIPRDASGCVANKFEISPDWAIEILSPDQSVTKVLKKLLHCSKQGTELGWLINPQEITVILVLPNQRVQFLEGDATLPVLEGIDLSLTVDQVFRWLEF
ncbi:MAG: Uma2 family endonuclease [Merismopedia sp. SIO2A8]|nr:Uma2 family endonuclease [Merismopedia sp. SIO2A8]